MKKLFILTSLLCITLVSFSKSYFISSNTGNDGLAGTSQATAWKTIDKLNSMWASMSAGDSVLFKRGEVFYGVIRVGRNSVKLAAYGVGSLPILSGFTTPIGSWLLSSANRYTSVPSLFKSNIDLVLINGKLTAPARFPNTGYLTYQSYTSSSITSSSLTGTPNYTGSELVWKACRWVLHRSKVTSQATSRLNYINPDLSYQGINNFGFFLQKDAKFLDVTNEWVIDTVSRKITVVSSSVPTSVQVSAQDTGVVLGSRTDIALDGLQIEGSSIGVWMFNGNRDTIKNCVFKNLGLFGLYAWNTPNIRVDNNLFQDILNIGVYIRNKDVSNSYVSGNTFKRIGMIPGLGNSGDLSYKALFVQGNNVNILRNRVDSVGYIGIEFNGNNVLVENNYVSYTNLVKDDGGGIYTYATNGTILNTNRIVRNNLVENTIGSSDGTAIDNTLGVRTAEAKGIYLDGGAMNVDVIGNTVINSARSGLLANNSFNVNISNNLFYGYRLFATEWVKRDNNNNLIRNIIVKNNVCYSTTTNSRAFRYYSEDLSTPSAITIQQDIQALGTIDSNFIQSGAQYVYEYRLVKNGVNYRPSAIDLPTWRVYSLKDIVTKTYAFSSPTLITNPTFSNVIKAIPGSFKDVKDSVYTNSIRMGACSGVLLDKFISSVIYLGTSPAGVDGLKLKIDNKDVYKYIAKIFVWNSTNKFVYYSVGSAEPVVMRKPISICKSRS